MSPPNSAPTIVFDLDRTLVDTAPDPQILLRTISKAGGKSTRAVMVGDSITDIEVARAARVPVIAVDFGYTETPVSALDPDMVIGDFGKLPAAVDKLFGLQN